MNAKKVLCLILSLVLIVGLFPTAALATEPQTTAVGTLDALKTALTAGGNIKLTANIDVGTTVLNINKAVTIDGDNHSITSTVTTYGGVAFTITVSNAAISMSNITFQTQKYKGGNHTDPINGLFGFRLQGGASNDTITTSHVSILGFAYPVFTRGASGTDAASTNNTITISNSTLIGRCGVDARGQGNVFNLDHTTINGQNVFTGSDESFACVVDEKESVGNTFNIHACTLNAYAHGIPTTGTASEYMVAMRGTNGVVNISSNSTITSYTPDVDSGSEQDTYVRTGLVEEIATGNLITIDKENTYNALKELRVADGYGFVATSGNTIKDTYSTTYSYIVAPTDAVANIEGKGTYTSLAAAVAAAAASDTVKLLKNTTLDSTVTVDKNLTFDLDGKTIGYQKNEGYAFTIAAEKSLTVNAGENGTIKIDDSYSADGLFNLMAKSTLTVNGETYSGNTRHQTSLDTNGGNALFHVGYNNEAQADGATMTLNNITATTNRTIIGTYTGDSSGVGTIYYSYLTQTSHVNNCLYFTLFHLLILELWPFSERFQREQII